MQHWRAQEVPFSGDYDSVGPDSMNGELADDRIEFVRSSKDLNSRNGTTNHSRIFIEDGNDRLPLRRVSAKQLDKRRGEAIGAN